MPDVRESQPLEEHHLECAECGRQSPQDARAWRGYLTDDGEAV